jgi:hypothetical protein
MILAFSPFDFESAVRLDSLHENRIKAVPQSVQIEMHPPRTVAAPELRKRFEGIDPDQVRALAEEKRKLGAQALAGGQRSEINKQQNRKTVKKRQGFGKVVPTPGPEFSSCISRSITVHTNRSGNQNYG